MSNSNAVNQLWSHAGSAGREWIHVSYSIPAESEEYQVEFIASKDGGEGVITSVDDVTVTNGKLITNL